MTRFRSARCLVARSCFIGVLAIAADAAAQDDPHAACAAPPAYVPEELLERSVPLRSGVGNSAETSRRRSPEAQASTTRASTTSSRTSGSKRRGRSTRRCASIPDLAMAYVGLSRVYSGLDDSVAAQQLPREGEGARGGGERARAAHHRHPREAARRDGGPRGHRARSSPTRRRSTTRSPPISTIRSSGSCAATPRSRTRRAAASAAARHRSRSTSASSRSSPITPPRITTSSTPTRPIGPIDKALEHGEAFARLSPAIPHAAHMWGHDLRRVGRVDEAIAQFLSGLARARLLRGREDRSRVRLAPRPQPRPARAAATSTRDR